MPKINFENNLKTLTISFTISVFRDRDIIVFTTRVMLQVTKIFVRLPIAATNSSQLLIFFFVDAIFWTDTLSVAISVQHADFVEFAFSFCTFWGSI